MVSIPPSVVCMCSTVLGNEIRQVIKKKNIPPEHQMHASSKTHHLDACMRLAQSKIRTTIDGRTHDIRQYRGQQQTHAPAEGRKLC